MLGDRLVLEMTAVNDVDLFAADGSVRRERDSSVPTAAGADKTDVPSGESDREY